MSESTIDRELVRENAIDASFSSEMETDGSSGVTIESREVGEDNGTIDREEDGGTDRECAVCAAVDCLTSFT